MQIVYVQIKECTPQAYHEWLESFGETRKVKDLDLYMAFCFLSIEKKNDKEYEPNTTESVACIRHYFLGQIVRVSHIYIPG